MRIVARRAQRAFVHVQLAENDRARGAQAANDFGISLRDAVGRTANSIAGWHAGEIDIVLDGDRDAVDRAQALFHPRPAGGRCRLRNGAIAAKRDEAVEISTDALCSGEVAARQFQRICLTGPDQTSKLGRGLEGQVAHAKANSLLDGVAGLRLSASRRPYAIGDILVNYNFAHVDRSRNAARPPI